MMTIFQLLCWLVFLDCIGCSDFGHLFTTQEYERIATTKRIRKEIRNLSDREWQDVVDALNIMKNTSTEDGQALYGNHFHTYDWFVCQHQMAALELVGDIGHFGPQFFIWHRAFDLEFENSLLSINPNISGAPYWDYKIDQANATNNSIADSIIFTDKYFGNLTGNPDFNHSITDGQFAFWKVTHNATQYGCNDKYVNSFGFLRHPRNQQSNLYVTRYGPSMCGSALTTSVGDIDTWNSCLTNTSNYTEFMSCQNELVHNPAHAYVGGTMLIQNGTQETYIVYDGNDTNGTAYERHRCLAWMQSCIFYDNMVVNNANFDECFDCPSVGSCKIGIDDTIDCLCNLSSNVDFNDTLNYGYCDLMTDKYFNESMKIGGTKEDQPKMGDFIDISASPNEPMFFFHHINLDRYLYEWQLYNYDLKDVYYRYPEYNYDSVNLNDIIETDNPFYGYIFESILNSNQSYNNNNNNNNYNDTDINGLSFNMTSLLTHKDIWDATDFVISPYTYDSIIELIEPNEEKNDNFLETIVIIGGSVTGCMIAVCIFFIWERRKYKAEITSNDNVAAIIEHNKNIKSKSKGDNSGKNGKNVMENSQARLALLHSSPSNELRNAAGAQYQTFQ